MLVISRKDEEAVRIARRIHVLVAHVLDGAVVLEVRAPRMTRIEWESSTGRMKSSPKKGGHDLMIVLDPHSSLLINREISVTLVEIKQEKARLGFIAPKHIAVVREEVSQEQDKKQ